MLETPASRRLFPNDGSEAAAELHEPAARAVEDSAAALELAPTAGPQGAALLEHAQAALAERWGLQAEAPSLGGLVQSRISKGTTAMLEATP